MAKGNLSHDSSDFLPKSQAAQGRLSNSPTLATVPRNHDMLGTSKECNLSFQHNG